MWSLWRRGLSFSPTRRRTFLKNERRKTVNRTLYEESVIKSLTVKDSRRPLDSLADVKQRNRARPRNSTVSGSRKRPFPTRINSFRDLKQFKLSKSCRRALPPVPSSPIPPILRTLPSYGTGGPLNMVFYERTPPRRPSARHCTIITKGQKITGAYLFVTPWKFKRVRQIQKDLAGS